jgi:peptidoglycan/LPS O-acetylase OafA/YrhL
MIEASGPAGRERLDNVDALRALAVVAVMAFHYTARYPINYVYYADHPAWQAIYGYLGVQLFFVISGFCIYMTAERCPGVVVFWVRRVSRLQPAYVAAIALTFTVVVFWGLPGRETTLLQALGNVIWLNSIGKAPYVDGVYWSLIVEARLYIVFGILYFALPKDRDPIVWWSVLCLIGGAVWLYDSENARNMIARYSFGIGTFVFPHSGLFLGGMAIYRWDALTWPRRLLAAAVYGLCCYCVAQNRTALLILLGMLPFCWAVMRWKSMWVPTPVVYIGLISYPLYLVHQNIGIVAIRETAELIPSAYGRMLLAAAISVALAALLSATVEHRFRKQLERLALPLVSGILALPLLLKSGALRMFASQPQEHRS